MDKKGGMAKFKGPHMEQEQAKTKVAGGKYASSEMGNPEDLKQSVDKLADYAKKNKVKY